MFLYSLWLLPYGGQHEIHLQEVVFLVLIYSCITSSYLIYYEYSSVPYEVLPWVKKRVRAPAWVSYSAVGLVSLINRLYIAS